MAGGACGCGDGGGGVGGSGEGAKTASTVTVMESTLSIVTPAARDRVEAFFARACEEAMTLVASPRTRTVATLWGSNPRLQCPALRHCCSAWLRDR